MLLPSDDPRRPLARLALLVGTIAFSSVGLAVAAAVCWMLVPAIPHDAAFAGQYSVYAGFFYASQPAKTLAFQCCVAAGPLLILGAFWLSRRLVAELTVSALRRLLGVGLALHLLFFAACMRPLFYYAHPPLWMPPTWLVCPLPFPPPVPKWMWIGSVVLGALICFVAVSPFPRRSIRPVIGVVILALAVLGAPVEFYAPAQVDDSTAFTYHLNAILDPLSQSMNGHHLLVDFPHIYGGYIEFLAPALRLFPRTMAVPLIALALPTLLAFAAWLGASWRLVRHPAIFLLVGAALLGITYLNALPPDYVYGTPRAFLPAIAVLLGTVYFRKPTARLFWILSALAGIASVWNLDTGLVLWLAWTLTLLAGCTSRRAWKEAGLQGATQVALLATSWCVFLLYLRLVAHQAPDLHLLLYFQMMVVKTGYFCVAVIVPSAWTFVALLYLTGLVVAALGHLRPIVPWKARVMLFLSLLGLGMFTYYMGRAAESNLLAISPPGLLLVGLLGDGVLKRVRQGMLPPVARWFVLPWGVMIFWWGFLFFVHLPVVLIRGASVVAQATHPGPNLVETNGDFAREHVHPGEADVFFLSAHSGFYYYLTGTVRPLRIPGNVELLQMRDMQVLIDAIRGGQIPKLFVERNFWGLDMYRRDVYDRLQAAVASRYLPVAASANGRLLLLVPR